MSSRDSMPNYERCLHMLYGLAVGDAIGLPFEHDRQRIRPVLIDIDEGGFDLHSHFQGNRLIAGGQVSDETEQMIILLSGIAERGGIYSREYAISAYMEWANSKTPFVDVNARNLFQRVKTVGGYNRRCAKFAPERVLSNAAIARCAPIALLRDSDSIAAQDCSITNPAPECIAAEQAYTLFLKSLLRGDHITAGMETIIAACFAKTGNNAIDVAYVQATARANRDMVSNKSFYAHAIYCAIYATLYFNSMSDAMDWVVSFPSTDSDTNAAVVGAVIGAKMGNALRDDARYMRNLQLVLACNPDSGSISRPEKYHPRHIEGCVKAIFATL